MSLNAGPSNARLYIKEAPVRKHLWPDEHKIIVVEGAGHVQMFATNNLFVSSLSCDNPIKQAEPCERNWWRGLILTTEEISEIEDKGLTLHWERRNLISDPLGCLPPHLSLSLVLAQPALGFIHRSELSALLRNKEKPRQKSWLIKTLKRFAGLPGPF